MRVEAQTELIAKRADVWELLAELRTHALGQLLPRVVAFTVEWAAERRRTGRLHFHDLLVLARDLLWSDAAVRSTLAQRWSVLMIDEFQDTDPLQVELVFALAAADPAHLPPTWEELVRRLRRATLEGRQDQVSRRRRHQAPAAAAGRSDRGGNRAGL